MNSRPHRAVPVALALALATFAAVMFAAVNTRALPIASAQQSQQAPAVAEVKIDNFSFSPKEITVAAGTTITWTNRDDIPHTVVSTEKTFKSKVMDTDDKFSYTFSKPGNYPYFCSVHPHMTGTVVVK
jgi:plastocyanin